nr:hypothetical protein [Tanacetum cinerariifolium]
MTLAEVEAKFNSFWKQLEDFIPMGSKEEAERIKSQEKVKEMMQLIPIEEVYVEALQVKHPIIDWKVYHEGQRSYWKITRIVPFFDTMLVQQGEGSGTPIEPHHTPSSKAQPPSHTTHSSSSLLPVTTTIPAVTPSETTPIRQYTQRARIAQSFVPPTVADEPASPLRDVSQGEACPTDSGFIADQDRATIDKSFTLPYDSTPRVTSSTAAQEVEINRLKERVKLLEDREGVHVTRSGDDAPIKGRSIDKGEAATKRISDDSEEMATVLTSMDAAIVLASGVVDVLTGSGSIPTASTPAKEQVPTGSDVVSTASPVFATTTVVTPYSRRKGKKVMVESATPKKQKVQEQIDAQVARELEEQLERGSEK